MYIKVFGNYLFGLCNCTEECCYCGKYLYSVIQCHLMGCVCVEGVSVVSVYQYL
jgi:hypothetical protein